MSRREPRADSPEPRRGGLNAYLHRFFTCWVCDDPTPTYSALDRSDGLGQHPDPVCRPGVQVPESWEVADHARSADRTRSAVAGRSGR